MNRNAMIPFLLLAVALPLAAADRATMTAPILKTSPDEITVTASFLSFDPEAEYRIGLGTSGKTLEEYEMNVRQADQELAWSEARFKQGFTSAWFGVEELRAKGYVFKGSGLKADVRLTLQVTMPRSEADRLGRFFIFVAKNYGQDTWYLEDGGEVKKENWE